MSYSVNWKDFEVVATGDGEKLERWGSVLLLRPDPQVIWHAKYNLSKEKDLNAHYLRESTGGGHWETLKAYPSEWIISYKDLKFKIKPMGFKHTGLFPEQAYNWDIISDLIKKSNRQIKVLNLFAYTGGATVVCTKAGAVVTHVDSSKGMVDRAKENMALSELENKPVRYIVEDCFKFVEREIRRGNTYDAIILDPPSFGRGTNNEIWKLNENVFDFIMLTKKLLSKEPLFVLLNSYTSGLQPIVLENLLKLTYNDGKTISYELGLPTKENIILPCGASAITTWEKI